LSLSVGSDSHGFHFELCLGFPQEGSFEKQRRIESVRQRFYEISPEPLQELLFPNPPFPTVGHGYATLKIGLEKSMVLEGRWGNIKTGIQQASRYVSSATISNCKFHEEKK